MSSASPHPLCETLHPIKLLLPPPSLCPPSTKSPNTSHSGRLYATPVTKHTHIPLGQEFFLNPAMRENGKRIRYSLDHP